MPFNDAKPATDRVLDRVLAPAESEVKVPTEVREEARIPVPKVLVVKTSAPRIWYLV